MLRIILATLVFTGAVFPAGKAAEGEMLARPPVVSYPNDSLFTGYEKILGVSLDTLVNTGMLQYMTEWLGVPYKRAGNTRAGTDCSGFVMSLYKNVFDVDLVHSSAGMLVQMQERIKKSELRAGDILFFKINGARISHVGIYLAQNKFIHAATYRGVVIDNLEEPYYKRTYYTAGRVLSKS